MRALAGTLLALVLLAAPAPAAEPRHAIALYGEPLHGPAFDHFAYVNPSAPKGGRVTLSAIGSFDTLNPFTLRGVPAAGATLIYDTLMASSPEEPFTEYGLIAESIEVPEDRSWTAFNLNPRALFHDGQAVTAEDVAFTFKTLTGTHPFYRGYYADVAEVVVEGPRRIVFRFGPGANRELPLILGQLPVLPKHYWEGRDFAATTLDPPLGSGPYRIAAVDPGRSITYERVADYWGRDLPVNVGRHNVGAMVYDYYRDVAVALQAFRAGAYDFRLENVAKTWATGYDFPAARIGDVVLEEIPNALPAGMQGFVFNTRRDVFADRAVRWAIAHAFDFEWTNQVLFHNAYTRTDSYFENSPLQATGLPAGLELDLLKPLRGQVPDEVFLADYRPPETDGPRGLRRNLLEAKRILDEAGWEVRNGVRVNPRTGRPLAFEILLDSPTFERVVLPFVENLERLGIRATVRTVDSTQYQNRLRDFDYDMIVAVFPQSLNPGNEQRDFWGADAARRPGSRNYIGISDPAVDALVDAVIRARSQEGLKAAVAALDRVLLWGHYVVPHWYNGAFRVAYWTRLRRPDTLPPYGLAFESWWLDGGGSVAEGDR